MSIIPVTLEKTISFRRLKTKNVLGYEVYATYKDNNYASGIRNELLDTIENPEYPNPILTEIELPYNENATWKLPDDAFLDRDHQFRLFIQKSYDTSYTILSNFCYNFNRRTHLITLDIVMKKYEPEDKIKLQYYKDIITKKYMLTEDCTISIKPIFKDSYTYGYHNIII